MVNCTYSDNRLEHSSGMGVMVDGGNQRMDTIDLQKEEGRREN
jgi:hypothetical protein